MSVISQSARSYKSFCLLREQSVVCAYAHHVTTINRINLPFFLILYRHVIKTSSVMMSEV
jgi:hypothetical protein